MAWAVLLKRARFCGMPCANNAQSQAIPKDHWTSWETGRSFAMRGAAKPLFCPVGGVWGPSGYKTPGRVRGACTGLKTASLHSPDHSRFTFPNHSPDHSPHSRHFAIWPRPPPPPFLGMYQSFFFFSEKRREGPDIAQSREAAPQAKPERAQSPKTREWGEWSGIGADIGRGNGLGNEGDRKSSISLTIPLHGQYPGVRSIRANAPARHPDIALDRPPFAIPA